LFQINGRLLNSSFQPYIIAELSANHSGSIDRAKIAIELAKKSGAHAIKFQTYEPDTMTIDVESSDFMISSGVWKGYKLYDLYKEAYTPYCWHKELFDYARKIGITAISTPFDETALELLEGLGAPAYKIASFELVDLSLINLVAKTGKPIMMSTGMASESEITDAIDVAHNAGCQNILLFHCVSSYPAQLEQANLKMITKLREKYGVEVGLSDHTLDHTAAVVSVGLGAVAIEKHFTPSRKEGGVDSFFSIEPAELEELVAITKEAWLSLGKDDFSRSEDEMQNLKFRRSIYFVKNISAGQQISKNDIKCIRPGYGLPPKYFNDLLGKRVIKDVLRGDRVSWDLIDGS
jgi:pseudaminic acid synthase